ncbi:MAG: histidine phosphatase family protein [Candidatus Hermodarchaeota archaeon]
MNDIVFGENSITAYEDKASYVTTLIHLLRHAETKLDPGVPADRWHISEVGAGSAQVLASSGVFDNVDMIVTSAEDKAYETALPIAKRIDADITRNSSFNELNRGTGPFTSHEEYLERVHSALSVPESSICGWETAANALRRFEQGIHNIESETAARSLLLVSHGLVLSLYFAHLLGTEEVYKRWRRLDFCSWGTVRNSRVVKDIV